MKISEIFFSVQGEGMLLGTPSVFIRSSGCNLRCVWCDTPYASWHPEGTERSVEEILEAVRAHPARHVVLTGGEPLIQPEAVVLTEGLRRMGLHITIETAGTMAPAVACDLMSVSPKLANSTPSGQWAAQHERLRMQPKILRRLLSEYEYQLKFVVQTSGDLEEIRSLVHDLGADSGRVLLMPEGTAPAVLRERALWLVELCKQEGFRFSPRLHVELWGNRRGV